MTAFNFPHLAAKLFNTPLAIHPRKAEIVVGALAARLGIGSVTSLYSGADDQGVSLEAMAAPGMNERTGYDVFEGVAVIPVSGTLVHRLGTLRPMSGMTGYDGIRQNLMAALLDADVKAILFDIDSPGGSVAGCFDLVDTIYTARGIKPMWAISNEMAYSAAYAIASATDKVIVSRTAGVGSVGVVTMHMDWSDAIDKAGLKVTIVTYGEHKADGNPYQRISKDALARIQADINAMGELFSDTVARNRGMRASRVRATEALCYLGAAGVEAGLADSVMAVDEAFRRLHQTTV